MTRRQLVPLALNTWVHNGYGKVSVSGFCSAESEGGGKQGRLPGLAQTSRLMIFKRVGP